MRALALDETLKDQVAADPALRASAWRVAERYVAGRTIAEGTAVSIDYMGESCRDAALATAETEVFLDLSRQAAAGQEMTISMEGSDRTDLILWTHERLCERFGHVGVTVQARLHRTAEDLDRLLRRPGRIRLVKGAYLEPESLAHARGSRELRAAYLRYATLLLDSGHPCSIATHDPDLLGELRPRMRPGSGAYEIEMLLGLDGGLLPAMRDQGHPVRMYITFGTQWWLYVWNRLAEDPSRLFQALVDVTGNGG
ncbi:proline dehydrogenase [Nonomuraea sp. PA05]|uniref:proline dehydrogenase family protein n=1 Tax=Nonomuraea sp. PA05 TaxID=2604466 RepID=UPI0011D76262|nr:proline dehydrogenase family protein [Nonomuraea sp. PA05]TYB68501.1 proline dehydrogenase [Nonomuraea sp. PA05]